MTLERIEDADIAEATGIDDLDAAALHLQTIAGIDDGGIASICLEEVDWREASRAGRTIMLKHWIATERLFARSPN